MVIIVIMHFLYEFLGRLKYVNEMNLLICHGMQNIIMITLLLLYVIYRDYRICMVEDCYYCCYYPF